MVKTHIDNDLMRLVYEKLKLFPELTSEDHTRLYSEVKNATLQGIDSSLVELSRTAQNSFENKNNSLLLWILEITKDKPTGLQKIKSPGSYADFDVDFSKQERGKVYGYLAEKYGANRVTHVATFGTLGAKAAVRSSARALGFSVDQGSSIAKHIPNVPDIKLTDAIEVSDALKDIQKGKDLDLQKILSVALKLEGLPNSIGCHACACVVSEDPLTDYLPLMISTKKDGGEILTQFEHKDVESLGLLKFDILGLKTLDVIKGTIQLVKKNHGIDIDIDSVDVEDPSIYDLINNGHNTGIFQFESDIFSSAVRQVKPQNINEISDLTSLLRPGPLSMGMLDQYIGAKFRGDKYKYNLTDEKLIAKVWEICSLSYGLMVYQEQVIKCFTQIAGFNEIEGDNSRRAMGKKKPEEMAKLQEQFVSGGIARGYDAKDLAELFKQIEGFSGYGLEKNNSLSKLLTSAV